MSRLVRLFVVNFGPSGPVGGFDSPFEFGGGGGGGGFIPTSFEPEDDDQINLEQFSEVPEDMRPMEDPMEMACQSHADEVAGAQASLDLRISIADANEPSLPMIDPNGSTVDNLAALSALLTVDPITGPEELGFDSLLYNKLLADVTNAQERLSAAQTAFDECARG